MRYLLSLLSLLFLFSLPGLAHAQIYKWMGSHGIIHYSDQPVPKAKVEELHVSPPPSGASQASTNLADRERAFRKRRVEAEETQKKQRQQQARAKQKQQNCQNARRNLRILQRGGRIVSYDKKGQRVYLDSQGITQGVEKAHKEVAKWCQ